jgi:uncharacterized hydantoinase/oxoprolinase family protein
LANAFKNVQLEQIRQALLKQMALLKDRSYFQLIGAGAGAFLAAELANQLGLEYHAVSEFIVGINQESREIAAVCFPAYAVAFLANKNAGVFA